MDIKSFRFDIWTDRDGREVCALNIVRKTNEDNLCPLCGEWGGHGSNQCRSGIHDKPLGLKQVWFVLERHELERLATGKITALEDGYHKLSLFGELCTFYDMMPPNDDAGIMSIPYFRIVLPRVFFKFLLRIARYCWKQSHISFEETEKSGGYWYGSRLELSIPLETLARFQERYVAGAGEIKEVFSDRLLTEMRFRPGLREKVAQVLQIGKNSTRNAFETITMFIVNDGANGYFFSFRDQKGRQRSLIGGIVNHAEDKRMDDWSIHT